MSRGRGRPTGGAASQGGSFANRFPILEPAPTFPLIESQKDVLNLPDDQLKLITCHNELLKDFKHYRELMELEDKQKKTSEDQRRLKALRHELRLDSPSLDIPEELKFKTKDTKKLKPPSKAIDEADVDDQIKSLVGDDTAALDSDDSQPDSKPASGAAAGKVKPDKGAAAATSDKDSDDDDDKERNITDDDNDDGEEIENDDYAQSYFDNGEEFAEEDDNLDEDAAYY